MDAAAVKQLQKHYYRKAVGASALALVGYCLLSLYLQWLCLRLGAFCWTAVEYCSGNLGQGTFWLEYRYGVAQLQRSELYFALSQIILIPVTMIAAGGKCRRDAGISSSLTKGKIDGRRLGLGCVAALFFYSVCQLLSYLWQVLFGSMGLPAATIPTVNWALGDPWMTLLLTVFISPVVEEWLFRGAILNRLRPYGDSFAIAASAILFALMHNSLPQLFLALGVGSVLGWLAVRTGNLRTGILLHMLVNLLDWGRLMLLDQVAGITFWLQVLWVIALVTCGAVLFRLSGVGRLKLEFAPGKIAIAHPWIRFFLHPAVWLVAGYCLYRLVMGL